MATTIHTLFQRERHSLKAIHELERLGFPYAAMLLCYVTTERCFKLRLMTGRKELDGSLLRLGAPVLIFRGGRPDLPKKLSVNDCASWDDVKFRDDFVLRTSLHGLETIFKVDGHQYSRDRNSAMHSGFYLTTQLEMDEKAQRQSENERHLNVAQNHLMEASEKFGAKIVTSGDELHFEGLPPS